MNKELRTFLEEIQKLGNKDKKILGIMIYGGLARKKENYFSDGDIIIYLKNKDLIENPKDIEISINSIIQKMNYEIELSFKRKNKWIIYCYNQQKEYLMKLEIKFSSNDLIKNDIIYFIQSRVNNPEDIILVDKDKIIDEIKRHWFDLKDKITDEFYNIVNNFINYYDYFLNRFYKGDIYSAWRTYTLAINKLAGIMALSKGEYRNLYQPVYLTRNILNIEEIKELISTCPIIEPLDLFERKTKLIKIFLTNLEKAAKKFNIEINTYKYKSIIEKIDKKYYEFYNFRDISKIVNLYSKVKIKRGLIFRSGSLSRYKDETILKMLKEKNIKKIIDLRKEEEIEKYKKEENREYGEELKKYVINIPLKTSNNSSKLPLSKGEIYIIILENNKNLINKIFTEHFSNVDKERIIIHCEAGQDRTGIIIALLLDLLGIKREYILEDYLASHGDSCIEYFNTLFNYLYDNFNGAEGFLKKECNISPFVIDKIKNILLVEY